MTTISKQFFPAFRADLQKHLDLVAAAHGLESLKAGNATFDPDAGSFTIKVNGIAIGGLTKEQRLYDLEYAIDKTLPPRESEMVFKGQTYTIWGMQRSGKAIIRDDAGKKYAILRTFLPRDLTRREAA